MSNQTNTNQNIFDELAKFFNQAKVKEQQDKPREVRLASPAQVEIFLSLCKQRNRSEQLVADYYMKTLGYDSKLFTLFTYDEMFNMINWLRQTWFASEGQLQTIIRKMQQLRDYGAPVAQLPPEYLMTLTGGENGTASELIKALFEEEKEYDEIRPVTEEQLKTFVDWYYAPTAPFDQYGVPTKIYLWEDEEQTKPAYIEGTTLQKWRRPLRSEFKEFCQEAFTYLTASKFIREYQVDTNKWLRGQCTMGQRNRIRELETRLMNTKRTQGITHAVDLIGNLVPLNVTNKREWNPVGYNPLEESTLRQFSRKQAGKHIQQLEMELGIGNQAGKTDYEFDTYDSAIHMDDELTGEGNKLRNQVNPVQFKADQFKKLQDMMFKLEAYAGFQSSELHASAQEALLAGYRGETYDTTKVLRDFFNTAIQVKLKYVAPEEVDEKTNSILGELYQICEGVSVAEELLEQLMKEVNVA